MAIGKDEARNTYFIYYKLKEPNGSYKSIKIRNILWKINGDDRYSLRKLRSEEKEIIEKDKKKRQDNYHDGEDITLTDLIDLFCEVCKASGLDDNTVMSYYYGFRKYLFPLVNINNKVDKILTIELIDKFRISLIKAKLKEKTINNKLIALKKLVNFARKRKYISSGLAEDLKDALEPVRENKNKNFADDNYFQNGAEDFDKFIATFNEENSEMKVPVLTMFYASLRIGEWQAIELRDLNFDNDTILINKQVDKSGHLKDHTKGRSNRIVRIPHPFMLELKAYVEERCFNPTDYIFQSKRGAYLSRTTFRRMLYKHLEMAGLSKITPHGLRHSFATRMFDRGYDVKEVQEHLGHASMETTMKYYIHYTKTKQKRNIDDLM